MMGRHQIRYAHNTNYWQVDRCRSTKTDRYRFDLQRTVCGAEPVPRFNLTLMNTEEYISIICHHTLGVSGSVSQFQAPARTQTTATNRATVNTHTSQNTDNSYQQSHCKHTHQPEHRQLLPTEPL